MNRITVVGIKEYKSIQLLECLEVEAVSQSPPATLSIR